jgi:hypothetical protein
LAGAFGAALVAGLAAALGAALATVVFGAALAAGFAATRAGALRGVLMLQVSQSLPRRQLEFINISKGKQNSHPPKRSGSSAT